MKNREQIEAREELNKRRREEIEVTLAELYMRQQTLHEDLEDLRSGVSDSAEWGSSEAVFECENEVEQVWLEIIAWETLLARVLKGAAWMY